MRRLTLVLLCCVVVAVEGQPALDPAVRERLETLFPDAAAFSAKEGTPPHFKALDAAGEVRGYGFYTTDLEPLERGYDGPIQMMVGVDLDGELTGVIVVRHHEPYGYFSIEKPEFAAQFVNKSVRDRFRVGADVDAVSTATITMTSATRAIRNGARRIARRFLVPPEAR